MRLSVVRIVVGVAVVAAAGCSPGPRILGESPTEADGGPGSADGGPGRDGGAALIRSTHFDETPHTWQLPLATTRYNYLDLDGDGHRDAVRMRQGDGLQSFGTSDADAYWEAFFNDGKAFPATFTRFSVPYFTYAKLFPYGVSTADFYGDGTFDYFDRPRGEMRRGSKAGFGAAQAWDVASLPANDGKSLVQYADIDGDKRLDAIITDAYGSVFVQGSSAFVNIARGGPSGFGKVERFAVPVGNAAEPVNDVETMDWDGDGKADLVSGLGIDGWRVWIGTGSGFLAETKFALPAACYCNPRTPARAYQLIDIDGDGRPDLVEPADWNSVDNKTSLAIRVWGIESKKPFWKAYLNDGKGFAAQAVEWRVPVRAEPVQGYNGVSDGHPNAGLTNQWFVIDWDGDGRVDLVDLGLSDDSHTVTVFFGVP